MKNLNIVISENISEEIENILTKELDIDYPVNHLLDKGISLEDIACFVSDYIGDLDSIEELDNGDIYFRVNNKDNFLTKVRKFVLGF